MAKVTALPFTPDAEANRLLASEPLALLIGMLLDQQFPMERAFQSPAILKERLGGQLDAGRIASMDTEELERVFKGPPALHRFPGSMARRTQDVCRYLVEHHHGDAAALWTEAPDGASFYRELRQLPGFGEAKARIFVALVGKRLGEAPPGWEEQAATWPSIADVDAYATIGEIRTHKQAMKAAAKAEAAAKPTTPAKPEPAPAKPSKPAKAATAKAAAPKRTKG
jgi:uncharacterized HhH-GPD family protein